MRMVPLMLCRTPEELRRQRLLRLQRDLELMELAAKAGEEFVASQGLANTGGDHGAEHNTKRNPWGWA